MKTITILILLFAFCIQNSDFVFVSGNQKITLKVDDDLDHLNWGKTSNLNLELVNIDRQMINLSAPGIRFSRDDNKDSKNEIKLEVRPDKKLMENDTLNLHVSYRSDTTFVSHIFAIIIK
jgi:hypothetical protein